MKRLILAVLVIGMVLLGACGAPESTPKSIATSPPLEYEIIREAESSPGHALITILVSPNATKEQALALADYLVDKYSVSNYSFMYIDIFDSLETATHYGEANYPESEELLHYLVAIIINRSQNYIDIAWMATERGY